MSGDAPAAPVSVRRMHVTEADVRRLRDCFAANGSAKEMEPLRWQYLRRPLPGTFTHFAEAGDGAGEPVTAGIFSLLPNPLRVRGRVLPSAQALDVLTDARWRGRGVFVRAGAAACAAAEREGVPVLYAFPNASSAPGFFGTLGWTRLGTLPFLARPLRTGYFLARVPRLGRALRRLPSLPLPLPARPRPDGRIEPPRAWDAELDPVWERFAADVPLAVQRDAAFLRWRFGERPGEGYEARVLRRDGRVEGLVAWCVRAKHGGRIGYLMELLHDPARPGDGRALLAFATRAMAAEGADVVLAWSLAHAPNHGVYRRAGFLPLPERLRPIQLNFAVRALDPALAALAGDARSWYLSYADSDTV